MEKIEENASQTYIFATHRRSVIVKSCSSCCGVVRIVPESSRQILSRERLAVKVMVAVEVGWALSVEDASNGIRDGH